MQHRLEAYASTFFGTGFACSSLALQATVCVQRDIGTSPIVLVVVLVIDL
jgi:hypothetical protein